LKQTQSGVSNLEFTIAWSEKYKDVETKCFLRCKAWRQTAEFISKYFKKGSEIIIEGRMVTEQWEKDGQPQSRTICEIDKAHFCGSKSDNNTNADNNYNPYSSNPKMEEISNDDSLPF
jgi:single-strand DNA-binding protein